jgi:hypothetical protein
MPRRDARILVAKGLHQSVVLNAMQPDGRGITQTSAKYFPRHNLQRTTFLGRVSRTGLRELPTRRADALVRCVH